MRRIILFLLAYLCLSVAANAQPRALGLRIGAEGAEISYQHNIQKSSFIEAELGSEFGSVEGLKATGTYDFIFARPAWTNRGYWGLYTGPGVSLGCLEDKFLIAFSAQAGMEYTFWFPLQLSIDFRQHIGIGNGFWAPSSVGLGVRYKF